MFVNTLFKDVYAGNGEFSRKKQRVVNESTVDIGFISKIYHFVHYVNVWSMLYIMYSFIHLIWF